MQEEGSRLAAEEKPLPNLPDSATDPAAARLLRRATHAAVSAASLMILAKLAAWAVTDSVALLSSLIDSTLDLFASVVTLIAVRTALAPADSDHRFGHGKAEPLAGLGQAAFIAGSAFLLVIEAVSRLFRPMPVEQGSIGIAAIAFSIVVTLCLVAYQRHVARVTGSVAIRGDSVHYAGDLLMNVAVIASLGLSMAFDAPFIDPLFAIGIAAFLILNAWKLFRAAIDYLMDREFDSTDRSRIRELALAHEEVFGVHDLRTRSAGRYGFIQLHLELDPDLSLLRAHEISDEVEAAINRAFPAAEVIIHEDPSGLHERHRTPDDGEPSGQAR